MTRILIALLLLGTTASTSLAQGKPPLTFEQIYQRTCANVLNVLPRIVRKEAVAAIPDDAHIVFHRVCTGVDLNDFGNVVGLGKTIWANHALRQALLRRNYRIDDVVGIQIEGDTVQLYVHRF